MIVCLIPVTLNTTSGASGFSLRCGKRVLFIATILLSIGVLVARQFLQMSRSLMVNAGGVAPFLRKRALSQWYFKITDYAQELLDDLKKLEGKWPERVRAMQANWIGRSEGAEIDFTLADTDGITPTDTKITVFTTRPDTLFGVSFFLLPPESPACGRVGCWYGV